MVTTCCCSTKPDDDVAIVELAMENARSLSRNGYSTAALIGYGPDNQVGPVLETVGHALLICGVQVADMLRVDEGRWWSYSCNDPSCCPPEGTPVDNATVVAAHATYAGHVVRASRQELADELAPLTGEPREAMLQATGRAADRMRNVLLGAPTSSERRRRLVAEATPLIEDLLHRARSDGTEPTDDEVAYLALLLMDTRIRDAAWVRIDPDRPDADLRLWRDMVRRVDPQYAAPVACLMAYAAFMDGDGPLANIALDRAVEADPDYSLAGLLRGVIQASLPPEKARLSLTAEELDELYASQEDRSDGHATDDGPS